MREAYLYRLIVRIGRGGANRTRGIFQSVVLLHAAGLGHGLSGQSPILVVTEVQVAFHAATVKLKEFSGPHQRRLDYLFSSSFLGRATEQNKSTRKTDRALKDREQFLPALFNRNLIYVLDQFMNMQHYDTFGSSIPANLNPRKPES